MDWKEKLDNVAVIGAAGKMGSGISLLLAQLMAFEKINHPDKVYNLHLIDINPQNLDGLWQYIKTQSQKTAEKQIVKLRELYKDRQDLVENKEIIDEFVNTVLSILRPSTELETAKNSNLIFEAVIENEDLKINIFKKLKDICKNNPYFFTNTSSIPIHILDEKANLEGRLIGFHFYNPPAVQKLIEIIHSKYTEDNLKKIADEIALSLKKKIVYSNDIAGFIGNGHFIRDGLYGLKKARELSKEYGQTQAIYVVNKISQDLLIRPMGIFQLIDYVGIDVFHCIQNVMNKYLEDELKDEWIEEMIKRKVLGGQRSDGSQKDGFLKYEKNKPVGIYNFEKNDYDLFNDDWLNEIHNKIGEYPKSWTPWKKLLKDPNVKEKLDKYFKELKEINTQGSKIALEYLKNSKNIGGKLVKENVAKSPEDVNNVLLTGFYHLYGPINEYV